MRKILLIIATSLAFTTAFTQADDVCVCCNQFYPRFGHDYEEVFEPEYISGKNIRTVTINITSKSFKVLGKDTTYTLLHDSYPMMSYNFNREGYVTETKRFGEYGKYFEIIRFTRNGNNQLLSVENYYIDDNTGKEVSVGGTHHDYTWQNGYLIKEKNRDYDNKTILPDDKSYYTNYSYDTTGRLVKIYQYWYFDEKNIQKIVSTIQYSKDKRSSVEKSVVGGKPSTIKKTTYDEYETPLTEKLFDARGKLLQEKNFEYDNEGRITKYRVKSPGMGTECPDGGNITNNFCYKADGSYSKVFHYYKNILCEMTVEYK